MRQVTMHHPITVIPGARPQLDKQGMPVMGTREPLKTAGGKYVGTRPILATPLFHMPTPIGVVSHWRSAAAKAEHGGDMTKAHPNELVQVPLYRGIPARLNNQLRAASRRQQRRSMMARLAAQAKQVAAKLVGTPVTE